MRAELISVGTELLLGEIVNTNAAYLARRLADLGVDMYYQQVAGDNVERLAVAMQTARNRADVILTTGGLGPTMDDATREALARLTGRPLMSDPEFEAEIRRIYERRGDSVPPGSLRQALLPQGAEFLPNPVGTAPGIFLEDQGCLFFALPGPPHEMRRMFEDHVVPRLTERIPDSERSRLYRKLFKICGVPEAQVEAELQDLIRSQVDPTIAPYAKSGEIHLRLATKATTREMAERRFAPIRQVVQERFGWRFFGEDEETLAEAVGKHLRRRGWTLAVGESCTGGLVAARLTDVPGSSDYFLLSVVAYSNAAKVNLLDIDEPLLVQKGAVSKEVAEAMAEGCRRISASHLGVGITGVAGPGGGTAEKPVGTVYLAVSGRHGVRSRRLSIRGDRDHVRARTVTSALTSVLEYLHETGDER